jgi:hypothetical protein
MLYWEIVCCIVVTMGTRKYGCTILRALEPMYNCALNFCIFVLQWHFVFSAMNMLLISVTVFCCTAVAVICFSVAIAVYCDAVPVL